MQWTREKINALREFFTDRTCEGIVRLIDYLNGQDEAERTVMIHMPGIPFSIGDGRHKTPYDTLDAMRGFVCSDEQKGGKKRLKWLRDYDKRIGEAAALFEARARGELATERSSPERVTSVRVGDHIQALA